jgi:diacylglycerol kinase (ATP)
MYQPSNLTNHIFYTREKKVMESKLDESAVSSSITSISTPLETDPTAPNSMATKANSLSGKKSEVKRELALQVATNLFSSFRYASQGVFYTFSTQRNFRIHCVLGTTAVCLGAYLKLPPIEMAVISLVCSLVLTLELLNTAIESVVDLTVEQTYHHLAKIAKDCAAGAVLISAMASLMVAAWLILPRLVMALFIR